MLRTMTIFFVLMAVSCIAQDEQKKTVLFQEPVLITSAGQSSDVLMAKVLAGKIDLQIDFQKQGLNEAFTFNNPNAKASCGCGESFSV